MAGLQVFDGPSLRAQAAKDLSKKERSVKKHVERALPLALNVPA